MIEVSSLYGGENQSIKKLIDGLMFKVHVAVPGIVQSYDKNSQTVEVQPALTERTLTPENNVKYIKYPLLVNVPVLFPQASNCSITFPIQKGDECLVIFSDLALDTWWQSGGVQNPVEVRRHDLSDGIAIFGLKNQKKLSQLNIPDDCLRISNGYNSVDIYDDCVKVHSDGADLVVEEKHIESKTGYSKIEQYDYFDEVEQTWKGVVRIVADEFIHPV